MSLHERSGSRSHLPLLDVLPHVFELMEAQLSGAVALKGLELSALTYRAPLEVFKHQN